MTVSVALLLTHVVDDEAPHHGNADLDLVVLLVPRSPLGVESERRKNVVVIRIEADVVRFHLDGGDRALGVSAGLVTFEPTADNTDDRKFVERTHD